MTMHTHTLTVQKDPSSGELGYALDDLPPQDDFFVTSEGSLIAHDLVEHVNGVGCIGGVVDELQALGGVWYTRGMHGDMRRDKPSYHSPNEALQSDIVSMAQDWIYGNETMPVCVYNDDIEIEEEFLSIVDNAKMGYHCLENGKFDREEESREGIDASDREEYKEKLEEYWVGCAYLMQIGFEKIQKTYPGQFDANNQFWSIADAVEPYIQYIEYEGQQLVLTWGNGEAICKEYNGEDEREEECDECSEWFELDGNEHVNKNGYTWCGECWEKEQESVAV